LRKWANTKILPTNDHGWYLGCLPKPFSSSGL
jgi:hypothetical protein